MSSAGESAIADHEGVEPIREAVTMVLYLSIVLLATFAALPIGSSAEDAHSDGIHGSGLVALIWGTSAGLALAHWFAFRVTARIFGGGTVSRVDLRIGVAQMLAAVAVALLCTIPVVLVGEADEIQVAMLVPAVTVGVAGFLVAKVSGRTKVQSAFVGVFTMVLGLLVAAVKNYLLGH